MMLVVLTYLMSICTLGTITDHEVWSKSPLGPHEGSPQSKSYLGAALNKAGTHDQPSNLLDRQTTKPRAKWWPDPPTSESRDWLGSKFAPHGLHEGSTRVDTRPDRYKFVFPQAEVTEWTVSMTR